MDSGAHFYNCDFQVHTPRDRQWSGERAITEEERENYAEEFIQACQNSGLDAVAITDHHDTVFIEHIREAARNEVDENGELLPKKERIVVFPGMELYLNVPCQALLLFDSDLPLSLLSTARSRLGIEQAPAENHQTREPDQLSAIDTFDDLYDALNGHPQLEGHFVVLPNVTDKGHRTLLRSGLKEKYIDMRCVGGYIDGSIEKEMSEGALNKVRGIDPNYGNKAVGLFQTSDNRNREFSKLGEHTTWVKWAKSTAEGIRQACLARDSRLRHEEPDLPSRFVKRISVSDSLFMGNFDLSFNRQYSALIGGRGTGKSTALEYLRWALGDEPTGEDLSEAEKKRQNLVQETLVDCEGQVEVELSINSVSHVVRRDGADEQFELKVGSDDFERVQKEEIRDLLPVQAYSQKQLSNVAVRVEELNDFVRAPVQEDLSGLNSNLDSLESELRSTYIEVQKKRELEEKLGATEREISSVRQQIEETKNEMTGLSDNDREVLDQKEVYDQEKAFVQQWEEEVNNIRTELEVLEELTAVSSSRARGFIIDETDRNDGGRSEDQYPDDDLLSQMREQLDDLLDTINERATESIEDVDDLFDEESEYGQLGQTLEERLEEFEDKYSSVRERADAQSEQMERLDELENRQEELTEEKKEIEDQLEELDRPEEEFSELRERWLEVHLKRSTILAEQCETLTDQSQGQIRARLEVGGQTQEFVNLLKRKVEGSNLYESRMEDIFAPIPESEDPIEQYSAIMEDLETLATHDMEESADLPATPALVECELEEKHLGKIARHLSPEDWLDLAVTRLDDQPQFEYRVQDEYIDFASASAGQQATALLQALLNQSGPPLIIDQPEDDLDNQVIQKVVKEIWTAKHERQLIFASHNANLVVNGDADLVVCFESDLDGGEASGSIDATGAIDVEKIRSQITDIMEGGQEAFELRKEKYGF
ncbi:TrlF family AAA-like ATPase [Salinibacter ruber]|uniref:TrlF family AAA-like ATPase n=1 Tax=Salinibacter ruber TaxID=146919 RepID=UPI0021696FFB|nr:AAA family ATPase [Salinibacter ruber]MCS4102804.1 type III restriction enzyme [Salinibacter ruber]